MPPRPFRRGGHRNARTRAAHPAPFRRLSDRRRPPPILPTNWPGALLILAAFLVCVGLLSAWRATAPASSPRPISLTPPTQTGVPATAAAGAPASPGPSGPARAAMVTPTPPAPGAGARIATPAPVTTTGPVVVPTVDPSGLAVGTPVLDLGSAQTTDTIRLTNGSAGPVGFAIASAPGWLAVSPSTGSVPAGGTYPVVVTLDRASAPTGGVGLTLSVTATHGHGGGQVRVTALVAGPPAIGTISVTPAVIYPLSCAPSPAEITRASLSVPVTDAAGVFSVALSATLPDGTTASSALSLGLASGNVTNWTGTVGASKTSGTIRFTVAVTGLDGRHAQKSGTVTVAPICPAAVSSAPPPSKRS